MEPRPPAEPQGRPPRGRELFPLNPEAPARWEWLAVLAICLFCLLYWILHYHRFFVPAPDTYAFIRTWRRISSGQPPPSFKRMPLFPFLMGMLGALLPVEEPELEAGLALNLVFSTGSLLLLYLLARRVAGWAAIIPLALMAVSDSLHEMAGQCLVEPIMGFSALLSFWLWQRKSRWRYLALFFAALTRYENSALIAVFFAVDWALERRFWKPLGLYAASAAGFLAWMAMSVLLGAAEGGNPYIEQIRAQGWAISLDFLGTVLGVPFARWGVALWAVLAAVGVAVSWRSFRRESLAVLGYAALYVTAHVVFGVDRSRYAYPIMWVLPLYASVGIAATVGWMAGRLEASWSQLRGAALAVLAGVAAAAALTYAVCELRESDGVAPAAAYFAFPLLVLAAAGAWTLMAVRRPRWAAVSMACLFMTVVAPPAGRFVSRHSRDTWKRRYRHYGSYLAGRWLRDHLKSGRTALVPNGSLTERCAGFRRKRLLRFMLLKSRNIAELPAELRGKHCSYVVYQHYRLPPEDDPRLEAVRRRNRPELLDHFEKGEPVPGFEHVKTLPVPPEARSADVQIYRLKNPPEDK
jgi:hypothetical protein